MNQVTNIWKLPAQLEKENISEDVLSAQACQQSIISLRVCSTLKTQCCKVPSALIIP